MDFRSTIRLIPGPASGSARFSQLPKCTQSRKPGMNSTFCNIGRPAPASKSKVHSWRVQGATDTGTTAPPSQCFQAAHLQPCARSPFCAATPSFPPRCCVHCINTAPCRLTEAAEMGECGRVLCHHSTASCFFLRCEFFLNTVLCSMQVSEQFEL